MGKKGRRFKINFKNPFKRRRNKQNFQPNYNNNNSNNGLGLVLILIIIIAIGAVYIATSCPIAPAQQQLPDQQPVDDVIPIDESDMFSPFKESYLPFAGFMF